MKAVPLSILMVVIAIMQIIVVNDCMGQIVVNQSVHDFLEDSTISQVNALAVSEVSNGQRNIASAAWWGFDADNATSILQDAIDSGVAVLVVPKMATDWIVEPLYLRSDLQLVFAKDVVIKARKGSFQGVADALFTIRNCENVHLSGYGATFQMHRVDYASVEYQANHSEWRHNITILGSDNVTVEGLLLNESGGDGIYIGSGRWKRPDDSNDYSSFPELSTNIHIRDVVCESHCRQGISVVSVDKLIVENTIIRNTQGADPRSGIDFEPNTSTSPLSNILVRNCLIESNGRVGLMFDFNFMLQGQSPPVSILIDNVTSINNGSVDVYFSSNLTRTTAPDGYIYFSNSCKIDMTKAKIGLPPDGSTAIVLETVSSLQQMQSLTANLDIQFYKSNPMSIRASTFVRH